MLTRDERPYCRFLRDEGYNYPSIASRIGCSERQARHACDTVRIMPQKNKTGRRPNLTPKRLDKTLRSVERHFVYP
ncbi:hypothetical protein N7481_009995 [Penicillium waksmanii]|uniref:uncharacterized protein n=1 Tax=Penicillium waksmanii TaxID=69791 RepID=UPI002547CD41|nr:uncharacterized protein N7481_009995 [Penicillium waksmanii]KAJ5976288.1 hypothetical protein N7481_009995 [Penicillium waksmanii]